MAVMHRARKAISFMLMLKASVGFGVAALALCGVTVPLLGYETTAATQGAAAGLGAIFGSLLALRG